jgi:hypothetical protein
MLPTMLSELPSSLMLSPKGRTEVDDLVGEVFSTEEHSMQLHTFSAMKTHGQLPSVTFGEL